MKLHHRVFQIFLLFLPTQLAYHLWPDYSFVNGIRIDYLSPTIFFTDILFLLLICLWFYEDRPNIKLNKGHIIFIVFAIVNILFSLSPASTALHWIRILQAFVLYRYVVENYYTVKSIYKALAVGIFFTFCLSLLQLKTGRNYGGIFYFLGERPLNINQPGVALFSISGTSFLRPYATFPHPNVLGGYAGLFLLLIYSNLNLIKPFRIISLLLSSFLVVISFSQAAWSGLFSSMISTKIKKLPIKSLLTIVIIASLTSPLLFENLTLNHAELPSTVGQRISLLLTAGEVISHFPLLGVGLGQFIRTIPMLTSQSIWWLQPVHNIPLLIASELGLIGLIGFIILAYKYLGSLKTKYYPIIFFLFITGAVDHYWLTIHQSLLLLVIVFGIMRANDFVHKQ